ncbi:MAG: DUF4105 domain-containing protein [Bacteriovoracaceae bacterium]
MKIFFLLVLFIPSAFSATVEEIADKASQSREWYTLMHYRRNAFFRIESEADGEGFFFSEDGKHDPQAEMIASVKAFQDESRPADIRHPQCAFPARFQYLKKVFSIDPKPVECKDYQWWRENLPAQSVTVIFASYYANNPASIFGHTFLRINSSDKKSISDYGVDFSALTTTESGVIFAIRGVFGGYTGQFNMKPYYMKLNEYIENENRDLWEYDLNLTPEQVDRLLAHIWELQKNTYFDYYFFRENCSYQLLTLLEAANPDWVLSKEFDFETIPVDTVKVLSKKKNAIKDVHYRPAFKKTVTQRLSGLSQSEHLQMKSLAKGKIAPEEVTDAKILEAAIADLRYERFEEKKFSEDQEARLKSILIQRAKVGGKVEYPDVRETLPVRKMRPDLSHNSQKYGLGYGNNASMGRYTELSMRAALHDLLDQDPGYPRNSLLEMAKLKLRSQKTNNIYVEEIKYGEAFSLFPVTRDEFKWSWRAAGRSYRVYDGTCNRCLSHQFRTGFGMAYTSPFADLDLYSMIYLTGEASKGFYRGYRIAPGAGLGAIWTMSEQFKFHYDFELAHDLNRADYIRANRLIHDVGLSFNMNLVHELRLTGRSWLAVKDKNAVDEIQLTYSFYY